MELLRHRPLSSQRGRAATPWGVVSALLAGLLFAAGVIIIIQRWKLADGAYTDKARQTLACQTGLQGLRAREAAFLAVDKAVERLEANPDHATIDAGLGSFVTLILVNAEAMEDLDYQHAVVPFIQVMARYRAGDATPTQFQDSADDLLVQTRKSAARTHTIINETLPQGC